MTALQITPNWKNKTARFKGTIAAGEHVAVSIANDDNYITDTTNLRLRVVNPANGKTLAQFPMPEEDGEIGEDDVLPSSETPAEGEVDWASDLTPLFCILNLNTDRMLMAVPPGANVPLLFVLDAYSEDTPEFTLFFKDMCEVTHWPRRVGEDEPTNLDDYVDLIQDFRERIDAAEESIADKVDEANGIVAYVTSEKNAAQSAAQTAGTARNEAQTAQGKAEDAATAAADSATSSAASATTAAESASLATAVSIAKMRERTGNRLWHEVALSKNNNGQWVMDVKQDAGGDGGLFDAEVKALGTTEARSLASRFADMVNVKDFGAKGDGVTDDTAAIQAALDAVGENGTAVIFPPGEYRVSKSSSAELYDLYPKDSIYTSRPMPCLCLSRKRSVCIVGHGAAIRCDAHGQGILDLHTCSHVVIEGLSFYGYAHGKALGERFPTMDTASARGSGLAEKGSANGGYYNQSYTRVYRNNCKDTSAATGVNGDASALWGTFGNGFINNRGYGLLLYGTNEHVTVRDCIFDGFNFAGFWTGTVSFELFPYDGYDPSLPSADQIVKNSRGVAVCNCCFSNIYDSGVCIDGADGVSVRDCAFRDIGHDLAVADIRSTHGDSGKYSYFEANPGYGVCCISSARPCVGVRVEGCTFDHCVRKGVDAHAGDDLIISCNRVTHSARCGIEATGTNGIAVTNVTVAKNTLVRCGYNCSSVISQSGGALGVYMRSTGTLTSTDANIAAAIDGNVILECWGDPGVICVPLARDLHVRGNTVKNVMRGRSLQLKSVMSVGQNPALTESPAMAYGTEMSRNVEICSNLIDVEIPDYEPERESSRVFLRLDRCIYVSACAGLVVAQNAIYISAIPVAKMLAENYRVRPLHLDFCDSLIAMGNIVYAPFELTNQPQSLVTRDILGNPPYPTDGISSRSAYTSGNQFSTFAPETHAAEPDDQEEE